MRAADVREDYSRALEKEPHEFEAKITALKQRFTSKLPIAKEFVVDVVHYAGCGF